MPRRTARQKDTNNIIRTYLRFCKVHKTRLARRARWLRRQQMASTPDLSDEDTHGFNIDDLDFDVTHSPSSSESDLLSSNDDLISVSNDSSMSDLESDSFGGKFYLTKKLHVETLIYMISSFRLQ
jgi:hypothetical protein